MRLHFITIKNGKKHLVWPLVSAFVLGAYTLIIGASEAIWLGITGGASLLVAMYAFVAASLVVIRVLGSSLVKPADLIKAEAGAV
jgi:hypothetical protein